MRRGLPALPRLRRRTGEDSADRRKGISTRLLAATRATVQQARRVRSAWPTTARRQGARLRARRDHLLPLVERVIDQAARRVLAGEQVPASEKPGSLFEPHTRIIPRYTGDTAVEFGRLVVFDAVEGGIVTRFAVLADKTAEPGQLAPALTHQHQIFGRAPHLVTGDRGLHAADTDRGGRQAGVRQRGAVEQLAPRLPPPALPGAWRSRAHPAWQLGCRR